MKIENLEQETVKLFHISLNLFNRLALIIVPFELQSYLY
jgi:hypothetical protein